MTFPLFVEEPSTNKQVEVPQEILFYCDSITVNANRVDMRYLDCINMHMGYYGNSKDVLEKYRNEYYNYIEVRPVFE